MNNNNEIDEKPEVDTAAEQNVDVEVEGSLVDDVVEIDKQDVNDSDNASALKAEIAALKASLEIAEAKSSENYDLALRTKAEADNIKRRVENDVSNARKFGVEKFANEMLAVIDSLEMGLTASTDENASLEKFREGSEMTIKMFMSAVEKFGVKVVSPEGEKFNPEFHQAMSMQESVDVDPNTVITVFQKGYTLQGRLMRPAMVIVSKAAEKPAEKPSFDETV